MKTPAPIAASAQPQSGSAVADQQLTPWQQRLFDLRQAKLNRFNALVAAGCSRIAAASDLGTSMSWIWRMEHRVREHGLPGLIPAKSKGSPPFIDPDLYTPAVVAELQRLSVKLGGSRVAARKFAGSPQCPRPLARYILARDAIPDQLRKLIGYRRVSRPIRVAGPFVHVEGAGLDQQAA